MDNKELKARITELEREKAFLPRGSVSMKTIKGKAQPYLQWTEDGKRCSRYIKASEREAVYAGVERRKQLEHELWELKEQLPHPYSPGTGPAALKFHTRVQTGQDLSRLCSSVLDFRTRDCFQVLWKYLEKGEPGRVCLLYGLRRTGKTTMLLQAASMLPSEQTAYIKIMHSDSFGALEADLELLSEKGFRYVFIDEVTLLDDFIDVASVFSDIYSMKGIRIVLSGTDSLGLLLSARDELYDRTCTIHTTFIPFREYSRVLGIHDIDEYIRFGGTFRVGETDFDDPELGDESVSFRDDESTRRYIDTAIARNIQHSLACYRQGTNFRHLLDLYDAGELTNAVNRIIEDMNHGFLLSVLTREFVSNDLFDTEQVTDRLRHILDIRNREETMVELTLDHVSEIKEYLYMLDLIVDCPIETTDGLKPVEHILFTQPGMRYSQAQALVYSLMKDSIFSSLDYRQREMVAERILEEVRGRMLEEIVLLETAKAGRNSMHVFKLQFAAGEFDMVVQEKGVPGCRIYEIKHSREIVPAQSRFLRDEDMCRKTEHRYGPILEKTVLYRGKTQMAGEIRYRNVEDYLAAL